MMTPFFSDQKIAEFSDEDLSHLAHCIQTRGAALLYNQNLDESDFIRVMRRFGDCERPNKFMNPVGFPEISLVTGGRDENGKKIGMFGEGELGWHSNGNSRHAVDKILIGLYCVRPDENTTLSLCQTSLPFYDLSLDQQEYWKSIKIRLKFQNNTIYKLEENDPEYLFMSQHRGSIRNLVDLHPVTRQYYFYFPYHFIVKAWQGNKVIDHQQMIERLKPIIFRSQYQFHFIFQKNDLLLMDQFTTLHRRSSTSKERLLWRIAGDYTKVSQSTHISSRAESFGRNHP